VSYKQDHKRGSGLVLELHFIDRDPNGMLTAEMFNWTGHILVASREEIVERVLQRQRRDEAGYTGVYLLLGEKDGSDSVYIGESENMSRRIEGHVSEKDWWAKAIFITSRDNALNKAHIQYLEARLIGKAHDVGNKPENSKTPTLPQLKEAEKANMEEFLDYVLMVLPTIGVDIFNQNSPDTEEEPESTNESPVFTICRRRENLDFAKMILKDNKFIVLKNSSAIEWSEKNRNSSYYRDQEDLIKKKVLVESKEPIIKGNKVFNFTKNWAFPSLSAAGSVVNGRNTNGRDEWKVQHNEKSYKKWEEERLNSSNKQDQYKTINSENHLDSETKENK